jgi:allantoinase
MTNSTGADKLYDYSPIVDREPIRWPGESRVAFYVGLNVEHFEMDRPSTSIWEGTSTLVPDPLNYGWRDYGARVGIWRLVETFDRHGVRPSVLLNADVGAHYPQIIEAGNARDWIWLAHGKNNSRLHTDMAEDEERAFLADVVDTIGQATGRRPRGWPGPGLTETFNTPQLLAELGLGYVLDWTNDDQPYPLNVPGMLSVPYTVELNDLGLFLARGMSGPDVLLQIKDQLDQLYADSARGGRDGPGPAPVRDRPGVSHQVPRPGARLHHQPPQRVGDDQRRDRGALRAHDRGVLTLGDRHRP